MKCYRLAQCSSVFDAVDFGGKNEIVFADAINVVGHQFDSNVSIPGQVQVGMMLFLFSNDPDSVAEFEALKEVRERPFLEDALLVITQLPAGQIFELLLAECDRARRDATFA